MRWPNFADVLLLKLRLVRRCDAVRGHIHTYTTCFPQSLDVVSVLCPMVDFIGLHHVYLNILPCWITRAWKICLQQIGKQKSIEEAVGGVRSQSPGEVQCGSSVYDACTMTLTPL